MSRIAFPTCEKNDTSNQEPRIMFFHVWAVRQVEVHSRLVGAVSYTAQAIALRVWREQIVFIRISSIVNIESSCLGESHEWKAFRYPRFFGRRVRRKSWNDFLRGEKKEERELSAITPEDLDRYLAEFIRSVRRKDGGEYEPSSLGSLLASVERHLKKNSYQRVFSTIDSLSWLEDAHNQSKRNSKKQAVGTRTQYVYNKHNTTWKVLFTVFTHSLFCIRNLTRSLRSLVRFLIRHNSCVNTVRAHFPWSILYVLQEIFMAWKFGMRCFGG